MQLVRTTVINGQEICEQRLIYGALVLLHSKATLPMLQRSLDHTATVHKEEEGEDLRLLHCSKSSIGGSGGGYWVTEKSDGIRCILTSLLCGRFPLGASAVLPSCGQRGRRDAARARVARPPRGPQPHRDGAAAAYVRQSCHAAGRRQPRCVRISAEDTEVGGVCQSSRCVCNVV